MATIVVKFLDIEVTVVDRSDAGLAFGNRDRLPVHEPGSNQCSPRW